MSLAQAKHQVIIWLSWSCPRTLGQDYFFIPTPSLQTPHFSHIRVFDVLFGPAYKGIPIATTTAVALADSHKLDVPYCFNRKEAKTHGEGGNLVGSPLEGKVMLVDDVITAGTAIRESMTLIEQQQASLSGVLIALDRQERGNGELSAIQEVERDFGTQVISIVSLADVVAYLTEKGGFDSEISAINTYRENYGI